MEQVDWKVVEALGRLDPDCDDHWTSDGSPRIDAVSELIGAPTTRAHIIAAAPKFSRASRELPVPSLTAQADDDSLEQDDAPSLDPAHAEGRRRYMEISDELERLQQERGDLDRRITLLAKEQSTLQRYAPLQEYSHLADQRARMAFIRAQQRERARRAESGLAAVAGALAAAAPIDRAMARKTQRGLHRPSYPAATAREEG